MSNTKTLPQLYTVKQVSEATGLAEMTIRKMIWSGELPARRIGRAIRITATDVANLGELI